MVLKNGDMERCLKNYTFHLEEPRVGQSYPNYYAAKLASKFVKVVLSGIGSDEIFGGYPWRYCSTMNSKNFSNFIEKYYKFWQRLIPNEEINNLLAPISSEIKHVSTRDIFKDKFKNLVTPKTSEEYINCSFYFEAKTFLHGLLVVEDKLSMAHGLETRVPFLDNDLVDFAQKIPPKYKLGKIDKIVNTNRYKLSKLNRTNLGKIILRKSMKKNLPIKINKAVKQGFSSPDQSWFKDESIKFVKRKILNKNSKINKYMNKKTVQKNVSEHLSGKKNRRLFIWSLLNFEEILNGWK